MNTTEEKFNNIENEENVSAQENVDNTQEENTTEAQNDSVENTTESAEAEEPKKELTTEEKLEQAEAKVAELEQKLLYKAAEFENYRKNMMKKTAELIKNGGEKVISTILPVIDDMELAQKNMDKMEDVSAVKEGLNLIIDKFMKTLAQEGLKEMEPVGTDFDTDFHEAIALVPGLPEDQKNKVIDCVQSGYTLNDKVIRHAKVAVAQ